MNDKIAAHLNIRMRVSPPLCWRLRDRAGADLDARAMSLYAIGDIQGCHAEFCQLLEMIGFSHASRTGCGSSAISSTAAPARSPCCAR